MKRDNKDWLLLIALLVMLLGLSWLDDYLDEQLSRLERIEKMQQHLTEPKFTEK